MPVRRPSRTDPSRLLEALSSADASQRESAAARLTLLGRAAVPRLARLIATDEASIDGRLAALRTLANIDASKAADAAASIVTGPVDKVAAEGIDVLRTILREQPTDRAATTAVEHLTALALSHTAPVGRRRAAFDALSGLPDSLLAPLRDVLAVDADPAIAALARASDRGQASQALAASVAAESLPDSPAEMAHLVRLAEDETPITVLHRAITLVRAREQQTLPHEEQEHSAAWRLVRGQLHHTLGRRGSRLAMLDLRETLARTADPLSVDFLAAATLLADAECLDALAERWLVAEGDSWLREQLAQAFRTAVEHDQLHRSHPALTRILGHFPAAGPLIAMAPRARRRSS